MQLYFDNTFSTELPADPSAENRPRQVLGACYSRVVPTRVSAPYLIAHSEELCDQLGLSPSDVRSQAFVQVFAGNALLEGMAPIAACYGGHQFGSWAGQLGDGRAISLGEVIDAFGRRQELQLKGAGPTPYSRMGDGRAVLRSSVREFLCSEAMYHLGVPTTRALCLLGTGDRIERDLLYDGNARLEPGAIVCRVAPSFLRFGNFEILAARGDTANLRRLIAYTLARHFPHLHRAQGGVDAEACARLFAEVCRSTAHLVTEWQRVGFVHGVLNTDNMSVLGLTIDYGPYGWLDDYDPDWTPNITDASGRRYRFGNQPRVAGWNLARFGEALLPLGVDEAHLERELLVYAEQVDAERRRTHRQKLGFALHDDAGVVAADTPEDLFEALEQVLQVAETDMTTFFRQLAHVRVDAEFVRGASDDALLAPLLPAYYQEPDRAVRARLAAWLRRYAARLEAERSDPERRKATMDAVNPRYVLRNYMAQLAIDDAEKGDFELVCELLDVLRRPYEEQPGRERFATRRPEWARLRPGCSVLSCSS